MPDLTKGDVYTAQVEAMKKLVVTGNGPDTLVVDAGALIRDDNDIRYWRLHEVTGEPGMWSQPESAVRCDLATALRGIANVYVDRDALTPNAELVALRRQAEVFGLPPLGVTFRRAWTPNARTRTGLRVTVKRVCNGCGQKIGDVNDAETLAAINGEPLPDVVGECPYCTPEADCG